MISEGKLNYWNMNVNNSSQHDIEILETNAEDAETQQKSSLIEITPPSN